MSFQLPKDVDLDLLPRVIKRLQRFEQFAEGRAFYVKDIVDDISGMSESNAGAALTILQKIGLVEVVAPSVELEHIESNQSELNLFVVLTENGQQVEPSYAKNVVKENPDVLKMDEQGSSPSKVGTKKTKKKSNVGLWTSVAIVAAVTILTIIVLFV